MEINNPDGIETTDSDLAEDMDTSGGEETPEESGGNTGNTIKEMAMSTDPSTPLDSVESAWDTEKGGPTRILRGFQKAFSVDGIPAIFDIGIGGIETMHKLNNEDSDDGGDDLEV